MVIEIAVLFTVFIWYHKLKLTTVLTGLSDTEGSKWLILFHRLIMKNTINRQDLMARIITMIGVFRTISIIKDGTFL